MARTTAPKDTVPYVKRWGLSITNALSSLSLVREVNRSIPMVELVMGTVQGQRRRRT